MENVEKLTTIIQAIQLCIIFFIVFFIFSVKGTLNSLQIIDLKESLINRFDTKKINLSLDLLTFGFISNLISIFLLLIATFEQNNNTLNSLNTLFKAINTAFFWASSAFFHFEREIKGSLRNHIFYLIFPISFIVITYFYCPILSNIVDLFVIISLTIFVNRLLSKNNSISFKSGFLLFINLGFMIWTFLQIFEPLMHLLLNIRDKNLIRLLGFGISAIAKGFILYGFYDLTYRTVLKGKEIAEGTNNGLVENSKKLKELNKLVNEIASINKNEAIIEKMINHLIYSELFGFDYAIFSKIDNTKRKILHIKKHAAANPMSGLENVSDWIREGGVELDHHDIMSQVILKHTVFIVNGDLVNDNKNDFSTQDSILDKEIFEKYNHINIHRLFIPVSNSSVFDEQITLNTQEIIGVLEVGFNKLSKYYTNTQLIRDSEVFQLYLNNITQTYLGNQFAEDSEVFLTNGRKTALVNRS